MESALKVYSQSWRDPEKVYRERRFIIRQKLPTTPANQLQNHINNLNEELELLKDEIRECKEAINQLKQGKNPENTIRKYNIHPSLNETTKSLTEKFKTEIEWRKQTAKWIRRERAIYLWEQKIRKTKALKLPLLKHQQKTLNQKALTLLKQMKNHAENLQTLTENYQKITSQHYNLEQQINLLNFKNPTENEKWTIITVSNDLLQKLNETFKHIPKDLNPSNVEGEG